MVEILFSGLINNTGITKSLVFSRFLIVSYATYLIAYNYFNFPNKKDIFKICLIVGLIQMPVVILQKTFYNQIMSFSRVEISYLDISAGTFFVKDDPAMSIFLLGIILILLFNKTISVKYRALIIGILLITIFLAGSKILQLSSIIILGVYFLREFSIKKMFYVFIIGLFGLYALSGTSLFKERKEQITKAYIQATFQESGNLEAFKSGRYSRNAAVLYYLNQPIKWFGDGPGKYFNVATRERAVGNTGHLFMIYSEVGLIGLILSYLILYQMSRICKNKLIANLYFFIVVMLSITSNVLNDASIVLAYNIFLFIHANPYKTGNKIVESD